MTPYYADDFVQIFHGDCRDVLPSLDPVETCLTDPPYGLSFMGRDWDHGVPGEAFWSLVLDALLPGAMCLAFGGTRTFHRLTCAIEDAGFEIRDCMMFLYGSGFPKSHNFGCQCGGKPLPYSHEKETESTAEHRVRSVRGADLSTPEHAADQCGEVLFKGVQEQGAPAHGRAGSDPGASGGEQPGVEGRIIRGAGEGLPDDSDAGAPEGASERVRTGAHPDRGEDSRQAPTKRRGSPPHRPGSPEQRPIESPNLLIPSRTLGDGAPGGRSRCPECGGVLAFKGWGSALKPSFEPIILAMKPLEGTFAENALTHGVAGLNIDGARIGSGGDYHDLEVTQGLPAEPTSWTPRTARRRFEPASGRWPANLVLDEEAAAMLDEQSGTLVSGPESDNGHRRNADPEAKRNTYGGFQGQRATGVLYGDSGGASRFFYTSKASRADRGPGNDHPTVKPSDLMKWLVKLTATPTGGTILDPFMGSGTTLYAAKEMGRRAIGIELEESYCEIAASRLAQGVLPLEAS